MGRSNSRFNVRYEILKKKYPDYLILLTAKNKLGLTSFKLDKLMLEYIRKITFNSRVKLIEYLERNSISYILVDSFNNLEINPGENYERYLNLAFINYLLNNMRGWFYVFSTK